MVMSEAPGFGERLRRARLAAGLTQEALAQRAGLTASGIAALERGRRQRPYPHTIQAIADALQLSDDARAALTGGNGESAPRRDPGETHAATLPLPPTVTIGRAHAIDDIAEQIVTGTGQLLTLTGPGGVGKTRLAMVVAHRVRNAFPDGVVMVPLAALTDPGLVLMEIAEALGIRAIAGQPVMRVVQHHMQDRRLLLVLDNFEHLLEAARDVAGLLDSRPAARVLVTSRAPLRIRGEHEYPVAPLALPELPRIPTREEIAASDAVQLFVDRAAAAAPGFALIQANAAAIAAICRRLDGLPRAIERAAARMRLLGPTELLARLDQALPLLAGGPRDLPERQQTMIGAIDWSYQLLDPAEQQWFRRLSVFAGGWDAAAAEAIGAGNPIGDDLFDVLGTLVEHSLVVAEPAPSGTTRYSMLETIRDFGRERLAAAGERPEVRRVHLGWCLRLAQEADRVKHSPAVRVWLERLEREHGNLRAALEWSLETADAEQRRQGVRLAGWLWSFWYSHGHFAEGQGWLERLLARAEEVSDLDRARAEFAAGMLALGDPPRAIAWQEASIRSARAAGSEADEAAAHFGLGDALRVAGEDDRSEQHYEQALAMFRAQGNRVGAGFTLNGLSVQSMRRGALGRAGKQAAEALELLHESADPYHVAESTAIMAELARLQGDGARAASFFRRALASYWELGDRFATTRTIDGVAAIAAARGMAVDAATLAGAAAAAKAQLVDSSGAPFRISAAGTYAKGESRQVLGDAAFDQAWNNGQELTLEAALTMASQLCDTIASTPGPPAGHTEQHPSGLTTREVEVIRLVAAGLTNGQVADRLYLSRRTIEAHLRRIFDKLDLSSRTEIARFAHEHSLL